MSRKYFYFLLFLVLGWQCKKYNDYSCEADCFLKAPYTVNPTSYLLKSIVITSDGTEGRSTRFFYNKNHLISKLIDSSWGTALNAIGPNDKFYLTKSITFQYDNGLCIQANESSIVTGYASNGHTASKIRRTLFYDDQDRVIKAEDLYDNGGLTFEYFKYDADGNIALWTDSVATEVHFYYGQNHELQKYSLLEKCIRCPVGYITELDDSTLYYSPVYDDKINFVKTINGLPPLIPVAGDYTDINYSAISSISPHNVIHYVDVTQSNNGQQYPPFLNEFRFIYNEEGLPIYEGTESLHSVFQYEKYR